MFVFGRAMAKGLKCDEGKAMGRWAGKGTRLTQGLVGARGKVNIDLTRVEYAI